MDKSLLTAGAERRGLVRMQFTFDNTCGQHRKTWPAQKKLNEIGQAGDINWLELILHLITLGNIQEHEHFPPMFSTCWVVSPHLSRVFATFLTKGKLLHRWLATSIGTVATLLHIWGAAITLAGIGLHWKRYFEIWQYVGKPNQLLQPWSSHGPWGTSSWGFHAHQGLKTSKDLGTPRIKIYRSPLSMLDLDPQRLSLVPTQKLKTRLLWPKPRFMEAKLLLPSTPKKRNCCYQKGQTIRWFGFIPIVGKMIVLPQMYFVNNLIF